MAVFTEVPFDEAAALFDRLQLGSLSELQGIASGIENTNYFASSERGRYVLTVFERLGFEQLPFYLHLMKHLAERGIPVPAPQADAQGVLLHRLQGKPAAVVNRLGGRHQLAPDSQHCRLVGDMLARMHLAGQDYPRQQDNLRGLAWWFDTAPVVRPFLSREQDALLSAELSFQQQLAASAAYGQLPRGPIHADLFRDNVLFDTAPDAPDTPVLSGFFDFYFAGVDSFLFDLGVCLNDWCTDLDTGHLALDRAQAMLAAYDRVRPLNSAELRLLPALMRGAALRFWISRLWDKHLPRDAALLTAHDPGHFERVLRCRVDQPWHYLRGA
jgi:homoserine kinase type II